MRLYYWRKKNKNKVRIGKGDAFTTDPCLYICVYCHIYLYIYKCVCVYICMYTYIKQPIGSAIQLCSFSSDSPKEKPMVGSDRTVHIIITLHYERNNCLWV